MKKQTAPSNFYQPMAGNACAEQSRSGRTPYPVFVKQKTTWMRFLLFCLVGHQDTAVVALQPIRVTNHRFHPYR
jgi:hypothetical protein